MLKTAELSMSDEKDAVKYTAAATVLRLTSIKEARQLRERRSKTTESRERIGSGEMRVPRARIQPRCRNRQPHAAERLANPVEHTFPVGRSRDPGVPGVPCWEWIRKSNKKNG